MERTRLVIHIHDAEERANLFQILSAWMELEVERPRALYLSLSTLC